MITTFEQVLQTAAALDDKKLAVCKAENEEVLQAVEMARKAGIASSILVGDENKIKSLLNQLGFDSSNYEYVHSTDDEMTATEAVKLVSGEKADVLMKGVIDTATILKAVLNKEYGLRQSKVISHVALFSLDSYYKMLLVTDAAMNIAPDVDAKELIIRNSLHVTRALGIETAKVAVVCANEKVSDKMPATLDARELKNRPITGAMVDGPFALDNAVSKDAARIKGIESPVAGDADILLMPDIEAGNILYKSLGFLAKSKGAGIVVGARRPIVLTSRADEEEAKLNSIALAILVSEKMKEG